MTWTPNGEFLSRLEARRSGPVFAVEISGHGTVYTTQRVPSASWTYKSILRIRNYDPGKIDPTTDSWTLSAFDFELLDRDGEVTDLVSSDRTAPTLGSLAGRLVTLWMGFSDLAQASWEKIGVFAVDEVAVDEYGTFQFRCIDPFPQLQNSVAFGLEEPVTHKVTQDTGAGQPFFSVDSVEKLAVGDPVLVTSHDVPTFGLITSLNSTIVTGKTYYNVGIDTGLQADAWASDEVRKVWWLRGNPVNIVVRLLLADFSLVGAIQTDFPLTEVAGAWGASSGFGLDPSLLDTADLILKRDTYFSEFDGRFVVEGTESRGLQILSDLLAGIGSIVVRRDGLLSIHAANLPAPDPLAVLEASPDNSSSWRWTRKFSKTMNRVVIYGNIVGGRQLKITSVQNDARVAEIGARDGEIKARWLWSDLNGALFGRFIGSRRLIRLSSGLQEIQLDGFPQLVRAIPGDTLALTHPHVPATERGSGLSGDIGEVIASAIQINEHEAKTSITVLRYPGTRTGLITPDAQVPYASASSLEKLTYAFICDDTGYMADGTLGYGII